MDTFTKLFGGLGHPPLLDVRRKLNLITPAVTDENKSLLERIAEMLTKLIKSGCPTE